MPGTGISMEHIFRENAFYPSQQDHYPSFKLKLEHKSTVSKNTFIHFRFIIQASNAQSLMYINVKYTLYLFLKHRKRLTSTKLKNKTFFLAAFLHPPN